LLFKNYYKVMPPLGGTKEKNMQKSFIAVFVGMMALVSSVHAEGPKEGKWSTTMVTKMDGMGAEAEAAMKEMENMPPEARAMMEKMQANMGMKMGVSSKGMTTTVEQCMSGKHPVPTIKETEHCEQTHEMQGNTVNFHVVCTERGEKMESHGKITYSGDSMQGAMQARFMVDGRPMDATIDMTGRYMGPC
jgi:hypothetical protein